MDIERKLVPLPIDVRIEPLYPLGSMGANVKQFMEDDSGGVAGEFGLLVVAIALLAIAALGAGVILLLPYSSCFFGRL